MVFVVVTVVRMMQVAVVEVVNVSVVNYGEMAAASSMDMVMIGMCVMRHAVTFFLS